MGGGGMNVTSPPWLGEMAAKGCVDAFLEMDYCRSGTVSSLYGPSSTVRPSWLGRLSVLSVFNGPSNSVCMVLLYGRVGAY